MKLKYLLFVILLLLCVIVFMLRQENRAVISYEVVGGTSQKTSIGDTGDVTFILRFTSETGGKSTVRTVKTVTADPITISPASITIDGEGTYDVTCTVSRAHLSSLQKYIFNLTVHGVEKSPFVLTLTVEVILPKAVDMSLEVPGDNRQFTTTTDTDDITFALRFTNYEHSLRPKVTLTLSEPQNVRLSEKSFELFIGKVVLLTFPRELMTESKTLTATVTATSTGWSESVSFTVFVLGSKSISLESLDTLPKKTSIFDAEDISCVLRVSNIGDGLDRIVVRVDSEIRTATLDQTEVELDPDGYADITLTIPRAALTRLGMYDVNVVASSLNSDAFETASTFLCIKIIVERDQKRPIKP